MNRTLSTQHNTPLQRRIGLGVPLAEFLALALLATPLAHAEDAEQSSPAAEDIEFERIAADDLWPLLETHKGKVILVNFWATWCAPCIHEIPALIRLREKLDPAQFALIAISVDYPSDSEWLVSEFVQTRFPQWNSYLSEEIEDYLMVEELDPAWPGVLPANYLIAPDGKLATTLLGGHTEPQFESAITQLIEQSERQKRMQP